MTLRNSAARLFGCAALLALVAACCGGTITQHNEYKYCNYYRGTKNACTYIMIMHQAEKITGTIPAGIGNMVELEHVYLNDNRLTGSIPAALGNLYNLYALNLEDNLLTGILPTTLAKCKGLTELKLGRNKLTGTLPNSWADLWTGQTADGKTLKVANLYQLSILHLDDNQLSGALPESWWTLRALRTMHLQNNKLTGTVPSKWSSLQFLEMLFLQNNLVTGFHEDVWVLPMYSLKKVNIANNKITGAPPAMARKFDASKWSGDEDDGYFDRTYNLRDEMTELWMQGNPWNGPCAVVCGFESGTRAGSSATSGDTSKWEVAAKAATACLKLSSSAHKKLPDNLFTVDAVARCTFKAPTCGPGMTYSTDRVVAIPDCVRCPPDTYLTDTSHKKTKCVAQITCNQGEKISVDNTDARSAKRTCSKCGSNTYQSATKHRRTTCIAQTTCSAGSYIRGDSSKAPRTCTVCPGGKYQDTSGHRSTGCKTQPSCKAGTEFSNILSKKRVCVDCSSNEYQAVSDKNALQTTCVAQPTCVSGQFISTDSKTKRQTCTACARGKYQDANVHRTTSCKTQPSCRAGTEFSDSVSKRRVCVDCNSNEYQSVSDKNALQTTCVAQPTCAAGQYISADSKTKRRSCSACLPGKYNDAGGRYTSCKTQPSCKAGTEFQDTPSKRRSCIDCGSNEFQSVTDTNALQTTCVAQASCAVGQYISADSKTKRRTCTACVPGTYQDTTGRYTRCKPQPSCSAGTEFANSVSKRRVCVDCNSNEYQSVSDKNALQTTCVAQPTCAAGQYISADSKTKRRSCSACLPGKYNDAGGRYTSCKTQPSCKAGTEFQDTPSKRRSCIDCGSNEFQSVTDKNALQTTCVAQASCAVGQYISEDSKTKRRTCTACVPGTYQDASSGHRETICKTQPSCSVGTEFEATVTEQRDCNICGDNEFQDTDDADALQTICVPQPTCDAGQYQSPDSKVKRRKCIACPKGTYKDKDGHRDTECLPQPVCKAGTEFSNTLTEERKCKPCGEHMYQSSEDMKGTLQTFCAPQPKCPPGTFATPDSKKIRRQCIGCQEGRFQDANGHRESQCKIQPSCAAGTSFETTMTEERTCTPCAPNTYQGSSSKEATQTICVAQPTCVPGTLISSPDSQTIRRECTTCARGKYQNKKDHREETCKDQTPCTAGSSFENTLTEKRECKPCNDNFYQSSNDPNAVLEKVCIAQPTCASGQKITKPSKTMPQKCVACSSTEFNSNVGHRDTECLSHPSCTPGFEFTSSSTIQRTCEQCGDNEYQNVGASAAALQTTCMEQTYCGVGQYSLPDSKESRRVCKECSAGQYQEKIEHRDTECLQQPTCGPGMLYKGNLYVPGTCESCPASTYMTQKNHRETSCTAQSPCAAGEAFKGEAIERGSCHPCPIDRFQASIKHYDSCTGIQPQCDEQYQTVYPSSTTVTEKRICVDPGLPEINPCSGAGNLNVASGKCDCDGGSTGLGRTCSEFSNNMTCRGLGTVELNYDSGYYTPTAQCVGCNDPSTGIGEWCQYTNKKTCNGLGVVQNDGTCVCTAESVTIEPRQANVGCICAHGYTGDRCETKVPECPAGYYHSPDPEIDAIDVGNGCFPCSPGTFAAGWDTRLQCDLCPAVETVSATNGGVVKVVQTSEPASTSAADCFAKFQTAPETGQQFCYGTGSTDGSTDEASTKPLSRITSSEDCSSSADSLGYAFAGVFARPYSGCVYDAENEQVKFYVEGADADNRMRQLMKQDVPVCERYVCKDPKNDVQPLDDKELANSAYFINEYLTDKPACSISEAQTRSQVDDETARNRRTFFPATMGIGGATLIGTYAYHYRATRNTGQAFSVWRHVHTFLTVLRIVDMTSDFGFYFISLRGAFQEAYGDGDPETCPGSKDDPRVVAIQFACVFFTALGVFLTPLDIWVLGKRMTGDVVSIFDVAIMAMIALFEDVPQIGISIIYLVTMQAKKIEPDEVAIFSLAASIFSLLFGLASVFYHVRRLKVANPTGWWTGASNGADKKPRLRFSFSKPNAEIASDEFAGIASNEFELIQTSLMNGAAKTSASTNAFEETVFGFDNEERAFNNEEYLSIEASSGSSKSEKADVAKAVKVAVSAAASAAKKSEKAAVAKAIKEAAAVAKKAQEAAVTKALAQATASAKKAEAAAVAKAVKEAVGTAAAAAAAAAAANAEDGVGLATTRTHPSIAGSAASTAGPRTFGSVAIDMVASQGEQCVSHLVTGRTCTRTQELGSSFCLQHTCTHPSCRSIKLRKAAFCNAHQQ